MIDLCTYQKISDKSDFIQSQNMESSILVVSDLDSKIYWQNYFLHKKGSLAGHQVMRAEDLWKFLVIRNFPEVDFVSRSWMTQKLIQLVSQGLVSDTRLPFAKPSSCLKALNEFMPIVCHPDSQEIMEHWFLEVKKSECSWRPWFDLAQVLFNEILKGKRILAEWSSSFLIHNSSFTYFGDKNLLFDLGPELRAIEVELLQIISRKKEVTVLCPEPQGVESFPWVTYPYNQIVIKSPQKIKKKSIECKVSNKRSAPVQFNRFSSPLAEVKFAIGQIHEWIQRGFKLNQIAIIVPDLESYWPILSMHFKKEDLSYSKALKNKVGDMGSVIAWLAQLKFHCKETISFSEIELSKYHPLNYKEGHFMDDKSLWSKRDRVKEKNHVKKNEGDDYTDSDFNEKVETYSGSVHDFINWATKSKESSLGMGFENIQNEVYSIIAKWIIEAESLGTLNFNLWIDYLSDFLSHQEIEEGSGDFEAFGVYSLLSGIPAHCCLQIFLGCSENQLKSPQNMVNGSDVLSLEYHTGHLLSHSDRDFREFQINLLYRDAEEQLFCYPETDWNGTHLVPSVFWLKGCVFENNKKPEELSSWRPGIWEQSQLNNSAFIFSQLSTQSNSPEIIKCQPHNLPHNQAQNQIQSHTQVDPFVSQKKWSLSPSSMQKYIECPFKFYAEKGFNLIDPALVDLELEPRTQGSIQHRLLELLLMEDSKEFNSNWDFDAKKNQLPKLINVVLDEQNKFMYSNATKELLREQLEKIGLRFLEQETLYRKEFPKFYTLICEAWYQRELKINGKDFIFRGKIDRIDIAKDNQSAIVIDYKSDISNLRNAPSWITNNEVQLPAYVSSVEGGFVSESKGEKLSPHSVIAAHYYSLKDFKRKGFTLKEAPEGVVSVPSTNSLISESEKVKIIEEFEVLLKKTIQSIDAGDFRAIPHPKTDCKVCTWRQICRTTQANL